MKTMDTTQTKVIDITQEDLGEESDFEDEINLAGKPGASHKEETEGHSTPESNHTPKKVIGKRNSVGQATVSPRQSLTTEDSSMSDLFNGASTETVILNGIFNVDDKSYDANLYQTRLTLDLIGGSRKSQPKKNVKKLGEADAITLELKDVFGVSLHQASGGSRKKSSRVLGLQLHTSTSKAGQLKHRIVYLGHPSENTISKWESTVKQLLQGFYHRPKKCRIFVDHCCGTSSIRRDFREKVLPLFSHANIAVDLREESDLDRISKEINQSDLSTIESVIIAGEDRAAHTIINALLKKVQFDNAIALDSKETFVALPVRVGLIPCGAFNTIAHTANGSSDMMTAALNILYGRTVESDVLSLSSSAGDLFEFGFSAHYGYGGGILELFEKSGQSKSRLAILKSLSNNKLRAYECEIRYVLAPGKCGKPSDECPCREKCKSCRMSLSSGNPGETDSTAIVEDFDPLDVSNGSNQLRDMKSMPGVESVIKGEFLNVSFFATPCLDDLAPLGFSKYTHMADGCMDLVLVDSVKRKDFMKFLQYNGNKKNQLSLPFVKSHRIKQATFHFRIPDGWNYRDKNYSEIQDQAKPKTHPSHENAASGHQEGITTIISQLSTSDDATDDDPTDNEEDDSDDLGSNYDGATITGQRGGSGSATGSARHQEQKDGDVLQPGEEGYIHPTHRYTITDRRIQKKREKEMAQEMKRKEKRQKTVQSVWNIDSMRCSQLDVSVRVHQKLITFYGSLMKPDEVREDVFCFPAI